jgi:hypothetical protein
MSFPDIPHRTMKRRIGSLLLVLLCAACATGAAEIGVAPASTDPPQSTAIVFPTLTQTGSATPAPTDPAYTPTAPPTPTATITTAPSNTAAPPTDEPPSGTPAFTGGPCDNILYPLAADRQWRYQVTQGTAKNTAVVAVHAVDGNAASVDLLDDSTGEHSIFTVYCAGEALSGFTSAEIGFLFFSHGASLKTHTTSGLLAPSAGDLKAGNWYSAWTTGLVASGRMVLRDPSLGEIEMVFQDAPGRIDWQTAGAGEAAFESVTVPAGTFSEALKVTGKARFNLTVEVKLGGEGQSIPAVLELVSLLWYQPQVGLVKQVFTSAQILLGGTSCPVNMVSQLDLIEYIFPS